MNQLRIFFNQLKAGSRFELRDGSKETILSLTREVRSFEILIPDAFVSRREGVCNKAFLDCAWQLLSNQRMDVPLSNLFS